MMTARIPSRTLLVAGLVLMGIGVERLLSASMLIGTELPILTRLVLGLVLIVAGSSLVWLVITRRSVR